MNKTKAFFNTTKYFWIGGILGILQQYLGQLDYILYYSKSKDPIFSFSGLLGGYAFWAFSILMLIFRNTEPKKQFRDILLLFVGLDLTYYLWQFFKDLPMALSGTSNFHFLGVTGVGAFALEGFLEFTKFTLIGAAAGVWGLFATKFRNNDCKKRYIAMLTPLFLVIAAELISATIGTVSYLSWRLRAGGSATNDAGYFCCADGVVAGVTMLALALVFCIRCRKTAAQAKIAA